MSKQLAGDGNGPDEEEVARHAQEMADEEDESGDESEDRDGRFVWSGKDVLVGRAGKDEEPPPDEADAG